MSRTVVHLLRHGEVHNPGRILYGRIPGFYLSERGQAMAQRIADDFTERGADVAHVVASPLLRAQQTATPLARAYGLPINTDVRVIEAENRFERSEEHTSELQSRGHLVCRLLLEKKNDYNR